MAVDTTSSQGADASSDGSLPARIGTYRVLRRLATGGTSDVLLAKAEGPGGFERVVVLKILLQEFQHDAQFEKMFVSEAAAYSRLSHPAIVKLYDFFSDAEQLVMVLEYVEGVPLHKLRALLKRGKFLDDGAAMFVGARVFGALAAAHTARDPQSGDLSPVIHRDVNPSNVLIPWDGHVKIADFGIAKVAGVDNDKTQAGFIKGTYGYMAPEQVRGETVTERADVYAACLLLWELLAGRKAIVRAAGASDLEVLRAMAEPAFPSLSALRPELPLEMLDALAQGLEPDPAKRGITAEEIAAALRLSCNLDDGRQRLVDALAGVRPPDRVDDLAITVSRPPSLNPALAAVAAGPNDSSADTTIPNLEALTDDALSLRSLPPLPPLAQTPPPPQAATGGPPPIPGSKRATLAMTSSVIPQGPGPRAPTLPPAKPGMAAQLSAKTLMGINPGAAAIAPPTQREAPASAPQSAVPPPLPVPPSPAPPKVIIAPSPSAPMPAAAPIATTQPIATTRATNKPLATTQPLAPTAPSPPSPPTPASAPPPPAAPLTKTLALSAPPAAAPVAAALPGFPAPPPTTMPPLAAPLGTTMPLAARPPATPLGTTMPLAAHPPPTARTPVPPPPAVPGVPGATGRSQPPPAMISPFASSASQGAPMMPAGVTPDVQYAPTQQVPALWGPSSPAQPTTVRIRSGAPAAPPARRGPWLFVGFGVAAVLVAAIAIVALRAGTPSAYVPPASSTARASTSGSGAGAAAGVPGAGSASAPGAGSAAAPASAPSSGIASSSGTTPAPPSTSGSAPAPGSGSETAPTATAPASPPLKPGQGTITVPQSRAGHRIYVDDHLVGESPGTFVVRCGVRAIQVGSQGWLHNVNVPCGADIEVH